MAGRYGDGGRGSFGLYPRVHRMASGRMSKSWGQRLTIDGCRTNLGLGRYPVVTLTDARRKAIDNLRTVEAGRDPRGERRPAFLRAAATVIAIHSKGWKNPVRVEAQWRQTFRDYAFPVIGRKRVDRITSADVLDVVSPIWHSKPTVAKVLRTRIGTVMKWAVAKGYRTDNPAGSAIAAALPKTGSGHKHHRSVPHGQVCGALATVRGSKASAAVRLAFEYIVLTATRTAEVRGARWDEIDLQGATWTVPANRMKTGREHRVPLSARALAVLAEAKAVAGDSVLVFPGATGGAIGRATIGAALRRLKVPGTVHGFRASFRNWCADTGVASEVAERALGHAVRSRVEAAYNRTDLLDRRREVMEAWGEYVTRGGER